MLTNQEYIEREQQRLLRRERDMQEQAIIDSDMALLSSLELAIYHKLMRFASEYGELGDMNGSYELEAHRICLRYVANIIKDHINAAEA